MTLQEIKSAVNKGEIVHWSNELYTVQTGKYASGNEFWNIVCNNGHCIGLTWNDEKTLNGKESEFYIAGLK